MKPVATKAFTAPLYEQGSWGSREIGTHKCSMDLYLSKEDGRGMIEWVIGVDDEYPEVEHIGLWWDADTKTLTDFDGVMQLPHQAAEMLSEYGVSVDQEEFC